MIAACVCAPAQARTIWRCVRDGTVSLSTAPEPGSKCEAKQIDDNAVQTPNLWGEMGVFSGALYEREQDGKLVYSTRNLPGSRVFLRFTVATPPGEPAHEGLGKVGAPRLDRHARIFKAAAKKHRVEDAWLRAIAHAESLFDEKAVSPKGALGVMQLMPETAKELGVVDALSPTESIDAGARYFKSLLTRFKGDPALALAAYNAGPGVVARYGGVPPYAETKAYLEKVQALYYAYKTALSPPPLRPADATPVVEPPRQSPQVSAQQRSARSAPAKPDATKPDAAKPDAANTGSANEGAVQSGSPQSNASPSSTPSQVPVGAPTPTPAAAP